MSESPKSGMDWDNIIYKSIYLDNGEDYYVIRGLKFYISVTREGSHRSYLTKIKDYALSLQDDNFKVHYYHCEKPKINRDGVFAYISESLSINQAESEASRKVWESQFCCDRMIAARKGNKIFTWDKGYLNSGNYDCPWCGSRIPEAPEFHTKKE